MSEPNQTTPMSDAELATFLGLDGYGRERVVRFIAELDPSKRALYDKMRDVELWTFGLGPKPPGVLVDYDRKAFR